VPLKREGAGKLLTTHRAAMGFFVAVRGASGLAAESGRPGMREQVGRFAGFGVEKKAGALPYLVERLMPAVYRRCEVEVPEGMARDDLVAWAGDQAVAAGRRMCLVLATGDCVYLEPDGCWQPSSQPPRGGLVVAGEEGDEEPGDF